MKTYNGDVGDGCSSCENKVDGNIYMNGHSKNCHVEVERKRRGF